MSRSIIQLVHQYVGKKAYLRALDYRSQAHARGITAPSLGIRIPVTVHDVRSSWGKEHLLVRPLHGTGSIWVDTNRVTVVEQWEDENAASPLADAPVSTG